MRVLSEEDLKLAPTSIELLKQLPHHPVFKYFALCLETPRPSKKQDRIRARLVDVAQQLNLQVDSDAGGNIRIRKPATPGRENAPGVVLQAHMDVVTSKNRDVLHDFETDPVDAFVEGDFLKARGTTLGADNGIGVAAALAVLEDPSAVHGPLETLFTADEEDDFFGVDNLGPAPFLQAKILLNLDSEQEGEICIGSAGGFEAHYEFPLDVTDIAAADVQHMAAVTLAVRGLMGGHTGGDIHRGLGNALVVTARLLGVAADVSAEVRLVSYTGGTGPSAICREADAVILVPAVDVAAVTARMQREAANIAAEIDNVETGLRVEITQQPATDLASTLGSAATAACTRKAIDFLLALPHGLIRPRDGHTETSIAFSVAARRPSHLFCHLFARSCITSQLGAIQQRLQALARLTGATLRAPLCAFPPWQPDSKSAALAAVRAEIAKLTEPKVYVVHGGLECGAIKGTYPDLDCVSIGPTILGAHSPDERLEIPTVARFYNVLLKSLDALSQPSQ